jgi:hypothetical protein
MLPSALRLHNAAISPSFQKSVAAAAGRSPFTLTVGSPSHRVTTLSVFCCYRAELQLVKEIRSEFSAIFLSWFCIWDGIWYSERKCGVFIKKYTLF